MSSFRQLVEFNLFGVCSHIGEKLDIAAEKIRLNFIYLSFITFGSPIILYFILAFWMNLKRYILSSKRNPFWYN